MSSSIEQARANDIREWTFQERQALNVGPRIRILCGDTFVVELPHRMLATVSTLPELHDPYTIAAELHLPKNLGTIFVDHIVAWLLKCCNTDVKIRNLGAPRNVWADLTMLRAGRLLGMEKYVNHIHRYYWWRLRNKSLTVGEAQDVVDLAESVKDTYLCLMAEQMADDLRRGKVRNPEKMKAFISESWLLGAAVENANVELEHQANRWDQLQRKQAEEEKRREEKRKKKEEEEEEEEDRAKREAEVELKGKNMEKQEKKQERTHSTWKNRNQRDAELNRNLMEKIKLGKKAVLTHEEARYFEKTRGKKCPYAVAR